MVRPQKNATIAHMRTTDRKPGHYARQKQDPLLTEKKLKELTEKLARLKSNRPTLTAEVGRLAELGDFSENVEYQLAKGKLRGLNNAILGLENQLTRAEIITAPGQTNRVEIGHTVTVECNNKQREYRILGSSETDPARGVISYNSPIGAALIGHTIGEKVTVLAANKEKMVYMIVAIGSSHDQKSSF